jgi:hypothetical protein
MYRKKQYNTMITRWKIQKKIKGYEKRAMIRKQQNRKAANPPKKSAFRIRNQCVDGQKLEQFQKDKGITDDTILSDAGMAQAVVSVDTISLIYRRHSFGYQLLHTKK